MKSERALDPCFDAFSSHEPVSTSLENALYGLLSQEQHARVKLPPHSQTTLSQSIFAEWGLVKSECSTRGVPSKKSGRLARNSRNDESRPSLGETHEGSHQEAASEALAQMLAVTAMLVIASFIFYWH
ncbi:hypothetical protein QIH80_26165 [Bradyrhizobium elkanii]|nr:hypothetical protein QIH80_26165 [Bradyrhizobium elkanii]